MERGTLKKILDSCDVSLTYGNKLGFALDAAKGMQYLHALSPPRIHRDIKSANLLVSQSWVVKVSDFGSARVVKREGKRQPAISRTHYEGVNSRTPLMAEDMLMTSDTGTILWRSPEIFALENYGTSADVYRYIVVVSSSESFLYIQRLCLSVTGLCFGKFCVVNIPTTTAISSG